MEQNGYDELTPHSNDNDLNPYAAVPPIQSDEENTKTDHQSNGYSAIYKVKHPIRLGMANCSAVYKVNYELRYTNAAIT